MSMFNPPASRPVTIPPMFVQEPETRNLNYADDDVERSNKEHLMRVVLVLLRGLSSLFSFLCFVIILTVKDFSKSDTYKYVRYVLAMSSLSIVYNGFQIVRGINDLANYQNEYVRTEKVWGLVDFVGDQVVSYMVLSGSSAGIAATNEGRQLAGTEMGTEYDKAAAATSMLIFAFMALLFPTLLSFHKLSQILTASS
ncbi:hypothetical protein V2J09_012193 [Rumex salicifolius]